MARKSKLTEAAVKIGAAIGKADRTAHQIAKAGKAAKDELADIGAQINALKRQLLKTKKRLQRALKKTRSLFYPSHLSSPMAAIVSGDFFPMRLRSLPIHVPRLWKRNERQGLPSEYLPRISECALSYRETQERPLRAKTNEMRSSTPPPAYLRSAVLPLPQRQRYQNKLASPRGLCLRTSRPRS